jgi:hypothetical protein
MRPLNRRVAVGHDAETNRNTNTEPGHEQRRNTNRAGMRTEPEHEQSRNVSTERRNASIERRHANPEP